MFSYIVAVLFLIISIMEIFLILGFPLGELTMGGQYKVLPPKLRIAAVFSIPLQILAMVIVLQTGGHISFLLSEKVVQVICYVFAGYFSLNTIMCLCSKSKKEKYIMTPMAFMAAVYFWMAALGFN